MKSDWKKSQGQAGTFRHTAGTYSGDPDDKGEGLFMSAILCAVRGAYSPTLYLFLVFYQKKLYSIVTVAILIPSFQPDMP